MVALGAGGCGDDAIGKGDATGGTDTTVGTDASTSTTDASTSTTDASTSATDASTSATDASTSTSPEDTSTSPEDTSTSPEDTSTSPEDTRTSDSSTTVGDTGTSPGDTTVSDTGAEVTPGGCDQPTLATELRLDGLLDLWGFGLDGTIDLGLGGAAPDTLIFERYSDAVGSFDLASEVNADYATCEQCLLAFVDLDADDEPARYYFQRSGSVGLADDPFALTLTDVVLEEVTIGEDYTSTVVAGGACAELPDGTHTAATPTCSDFTLPAALEELADIMIYGYGLDEDLDLGLGGPEPDMLIFDFYSEETGSFDLATGANGNYATCDQCILALVDLDDAGDPALTLFQRAGTLGVGASPGALPMSLTLTDVVLEEVTIDEFDSSTPVPSGACVELGDGTVATP